MSRVTRQLKILEIISKHDVDTQEELVRFLKRDGFDVTQATISRDIKDMNLIKTPVPNGRGYKYVQPTQKESNPADKFLRMFKNTVLSIRSSGNLVVIRTEPGSAGPAAELVDRLNLKEVLGAIAGENTVFVAVDSFDDTEIVKNKLESLLNSNVDGIF